MCRYVTCCEQLRAHGDELPHGHADGEPDDGDLAPVAQLAQRRRHRGRVQTARAWIMHKCTDFTGRG